MKEIDQFIFEKILYAFKRDVADRYEGVVLEHFTVPKDDNIKICLVYKYYGAYKSRDILYRKDFMIQDAIYHLFKIAGSQELDAEIREMICQVKSIQHNPK